ncbi:MAG: hypothetical protein GX272_09245 [Epulopiscium sp.]|jgi:hypothetical protein|nr:hypothetical protein [Candidatus Epulonipiscium sp.]
MPKLINTENNIVMELNLVKNERFDVKIGRDDFENWIPFVFDFIIEKIEVYSYTEESIASFSIEDIKIMITRFESVIKDKSEGIELKRLGWGPIENYFSIELYETYEENRVNVDLWISVGELTLGKSSGYDRGFSFEVTIDSLKTFIEGIKEQFKVLVE